MHARAEVDLDAIAGNVATLAASAPTARVMAVVKADGYGHGLLPAARAALAGGASWLGCSQLVEALALRSGGVTAPLLSWLTVPDDPFDDAVTAGIDLAVSAPGTIDAVAAAARRAGRAARVHVKVDTGLRRNGVLPADLPAVLARVHAAGGAVQLVGVMSHLVLADDPGAAVTDQQLGRFTAAVALVRDAGWPDVLAHLANSAATLHRPDTHFDLVRPGLAVYGLTPTPQEGDPASVGLTPAMTLIAPVALSKPVLAGEGVSYGHTWHAPRDTSIALVPVGYADGVPRAASNRAAVWLAGAQRLLVGRVCMDQFCVETGGELLPVGEPVTVFGPGRAGEPTAQDWAVACDTISYEIVTRVGARVPRVYTGALASTAAPTGRAA